MAGAGPERVRAGTEDPALMSPGRLTPHLIGVGHAMSHPSPDRRGTRYVSPIMHHASCIMHQALATRFIVLSPLLLGI
jgi:hypothetical protein